MNDKKITLGTTTKKIPSTMMAAATTIALVLASADRILGIQKQRPRQKFQRKRIVNKKIYPYYLAGTMIAMANCLCCNSDPMQRSEIKLREFE